MSTEFFNDQWRIPSNENQNKISNYSMSFDGNNQGINIGSDFPYPSRSADPWSISFWIKPNSATSSGTIFSTYDVSDIRGLYVWLRTGGSNNDPLHVSSLMRAGTSGYSSVATSNPIAVGEWQHIVVAFDGSYNATLRGITIYVNGSPVSIYRIGSSMANGSLITPVDKYIGQIENNSSYLTNCDLDQVTFFDYELSQDQVTQLGAEGYAFNFNGSTQTIDCGVGSRFDVDQITISGWVKRRSSIGNYAVVAGIRNTNNGPTPYMINLQTASSKSIKFIVTQSNSTSVIATSNTLIENDIWYHVVAVADGSNVKIYVNGVLQTDQKTYDGTIISPTQNFNIGRQVSAPAYYWDGELSNISVFNTGLTGPQVTTLYNSGKPLADMSSFTSLQGWWKLDNTATFNSGWSIPDASSNSNTGTSVGMNASNLVASNINGELIANPMATSPKPIAYYQLGDQSVDNGANYLVPNNSLSDYVFDFDGTDDSIDLGDSDTFSFGNGITDSPFSISAWINMTSNASVFRIVNKYDTNYEYQFDVLSGVLRFFVLNDPFTGYRGRTGSTLNTGQWYHVVATYSGVGGSAAQNGMELYVNGQNVVSSASTFGSYTAMSNTTAPVYIGRVATTYSNGEISNAAIFNTELTGPQVQTIYNNGAPNDISSLNPTAWYKLNASEIFNSTSAEWSVDNNAYPSVYRSSLNFDGVNDYLDANRTVASNLDFSVSAWINPTSHGTAILGTRGLASASTSNGFTMLISPSGNLRVRIFTETSNNFEVQTGSTISLNNWSHVAMTYDSSTKTLKSYLNGAQAGSIVGTDPSVASIADLDIGRASIGAGSPHDYFNAEISNAAIFNTKLTSAQVTTIYNNGTPEASISHSPTSWYKLDNTTTGIQDSAGSNNGTNNGATEYDGFVNALAGESVGMDSSNLVVSDLQQTSGYSPYALDFDGVDDYLDCGNDSSLQITGAMTISYWVKGTSTLGAAGVGTLEDASSPGYLLGPNTTGTISFNIGLTSSSLFSASTTQQITTTEWHHIVGVYTPSVSMKIYIDGQLSKTETSNIPSSQYAGGNDFKIGYRTCCKIDGQISNVAIWNTDLSSSEINEIYNEGVPGNLHNFSGTSPVSWWQIGSNSSFNTNWTCLDEIGTNNAVSVNMANDDIVDGPGYSASGLGTSSIDIKGDAPYSTANGLSENMDVLDRTTDVPS